jgi:hypothetical protein
MDGLPEKDHENASKKINGSKEEVVDRKDQIYQKNPGKDGEE